MKITLTLEDTESGMTVSGVTDPPITEGQPNTPAMMACMAIMNFLNQMEEDGKKVAQGEQAKN